jgi:hypothetical protein
MIEAIDVAVVIVVLAWPGWRLLSILGIQNLGLELAATAAIGLGLAAVAAATWLGYLTSTGLVGAVVVSVAILLAVAVIKPRRWLPHPEWTASGPLGRWSLAVAAFAGALAAYSGPWLSHTADTFYHIAAARAVLRNHQALPQEIFFTGTVPYPDATSGTINVVLAWLSPLGGMFAAFDALTAAGAVFIVLAFMAFAFELTNSRGAALVSGLLYFLFVSHFDFRIAGYPNQVGPALAWLSMAFVVRFARQWERKPWGELVVAALLAFAAGAVHAGMPPFLVVLTGASVAAAVPFSLIKHRLRPLTWFAAGGAAIVLVSLPMLAARLLALPAPGPDGSLAMDPPLLGVFQAPWRLPAVDLHFWFSGKVSIPVLATALLLFRPLRALWSGEPGAAVLWGGVLVVPVAAVVPFVAERPQDFYFLARIAELFAPLLYIVLAWNLVGALGFVAPFIDRPPQSIRSAFEAVAAGGLIVLSAGLSYGDVREVASLYKPSGARSVELSQRSDLTHVWADRIAALDNAGPGVVLADATVAYELAGLTGREVVAVWPSHFPFQDEARDGPMRRGDTLEALSPSVDPMQLAAILERYRVAYVVIDRTQDGDAEWAAAQQQPLFQRIAGGSGWALYRYARENLDSALGISTAGGLGVGPASALAGRAFFIRIASCCRAGTSVEVSAEGGAHHFVFNSGINVPAASAATSTVPVLIPDQAPPDVYAVSVRAGGAALPAVAIRIGRSYEAEYFAGVLPERDSDKNAWHQWVSIHDSTYGRGLASYTRTLNVAATKPIDLPAGTYCMSAAVYDPGDGAERDLAVAVAGETLTYSWSGVAAGMREVVKMVTLPGGSAQLAYRAVAPAQIPVIVDRIIFYPPSTGGGAPAC